MNQLFVSYARSDAQEVLPIVRRLRDELRERSLQVQLWVDTEELRPGASWRDEIERGLLDSIGLLVFVSPNSVRSSWVVSELALVARRSDRLIIPIILEHVPNLPPQLANRQWIDLTEELGTKQILEAVSKIADALEGHLSRHASGRIVAPAEASTIAGEIAADVRRSVQIGDDDGNSKQSIFLVHGHDSDAVAKLQEFLARHKVEPIVLSKIPGASQSLLQRFLTAASNAKFAIVLLSADDLGASRRQYELPKVAEHALQFRARQNVLLELGFFYGHLGWENVFVLYRAPDADFPNFERPSDLDGVVFDTLDTDGTWRDALTSRLRSAGFRVG
jgi:predicted nucleotide-binding protein